MMNIFGLIDRVKTLEQRISVALFYSGLRIPQYRALVYIENTRNVTVTDLSRHFSNTRATTSQLASELVKMGALVTIDNPSDRRSYFLQLTPLGRSKLAVGKRDVELVLNSISRDYSPEMIELLNGFVDSEH